jgi:hypothetical protein
MLSSSQERERSEAAARVFEFMRKRKLTLADLIEVGGEDLRSPDSKIVKRARAVEQCWSLMARFSLSYPDLEKTARETPDAPRRRRRNGRVHLANP